MPPKFIVIQVSSRRWEVAKMSHGCNGVWFYDPQGERYDNPIKAAKAADEMNKET